MRMLSPLSTEWSWPSRRFSSDLMGEVISDFDRLVDSFLQPMQASTVNYQPSCDISETKDHYMVTFDMPGTKKEDIKIQVQGNQLVISGERHREVKAQSEGATLRHERVYGKFERAFILPETINADKIEAHYEDGVLSVALPKVEGAKTRTIQIQTSQGGLFNKILGSKKEVTKELNDAKVS